MAVGSKKNNTNSLLNEEAAGDKTVSDAINDAFDYAELSTVGKLCLDARVNKGLTQEQAGSLLKVRVKIIKDFQKPRPPTLWLLKIGRAFACQVVNHSRLVRSLLRQG